MAHENDTATAAAEETGPSTKRVEMAVAALLLMLGVVVLYQSRLLGAGWTTDGPGPGYFPFYIGLILVVSSLGTLYQVMSAKSAKSGVFVTHEQLKLVLSVLVPALVYVGAVQVLGIYVASTIYIALFMVILGKYHWGKSAIVAVSVNALLFCLFEVWFKVPLFKGALDPLAFLD